MKKAFVLLTLLIMTGCSSIGRDLAMGRAKHEKQHIDFAISYYDKFVSSDQGIKNLNAIKKYNVGEKFLTYFEEELNNKTNNLEEIGTKYYVENYSSQHRDLRLKSNCQFSKTDIENFKKKYNKEHKKREIVDKDFDIFLQNISKEDFIGQALWKYVALGSEDSTLFYNVRLNSTVDLRVCNVESLNAVELNLFHNLIMSDGYSNFSNSFYEVYKKVKARIISDIEKL